ncbi:Hypothetical predicted protein [Marmota monax]|uniref:Uncharacterized protein n=1 Tax=Marmota monax TaxID=9995 RepID=A0A5E4AZB3_MARMO|nr:hypothetical protein GHT09_020472 [Marmota monax]VTJ62081.1 Hypothetical predicted protein [Marmota monax]
MPTLPASPCRQAGLGAGSWSQRRCCPLLAITRYCTHPAVAFAEKEQRVDRPSPGGVRNGCHPKPPTQPPPALREPCRRTLEMKRV